MDERYLRSRARNKALLSVLVLGGVIAAQVLSVIVILILQITEDSLWYAILPQLFSVAWAVTGVVLLGGGSLAIPTFDDIRHTFRFGWSCIGVAVALMLFEVFSYVGEGSAVDPMWPLKIAECALLCLLVGFHEEFVFRGIIFHGLLALMGATHKGLVRACIASALIFGVMHIDFSADFASPITCVQAVLKIIQTGMFGILMCAIVLNKRRLIGVSLLHGADDFLLMVVSIGLFSQPFETEYTTTGEDAMATIVLYLVVIAAYLPFTIKSLREIRNRGYVWRGAFMDRDVALMRERERKEQERARMQAQAALWAQGPVRPQAVPLAQVAPYPGQVPGHVAPYGQVPVQPQTAPYGQAPVQPQTAPYGQAPAQPQTAPYGQTPVQSQTAPYGQVPVQPQTAPYGYGQAPVQPQAPQRPGQTPPNSARPQAVPLAQVPRRNDDFGNRPPAPKGLA